MEFFVHNFFPNISDDQIVGLADKEFPVETSVPALGVSCKKDTRDTTGGVAEYPDYPLIFLSPVPKSASRSSTKIRDKYVTHLGNFGKSLFLFPRKF